MGKAATGHIRLRCGEARAEISVLGAELRHWEVGGLSLLWRPDPSIWDATAPILFPVVGWTRGGQVRVAGRSYPLGLHGFARHKRFRVARLTESFLRLVLDSDAETLALYPFAFRFGVEYELKGSALEVRLSVLNRGPRRMPYACGLHPGFRWPLVSGGQKDHRILFDAEENPAVPEITSNGLFAPRKRPIPLEGRILNLIPDLFAREALCFLDAKSQGLRYEGGDGPSLRVDTQNFRHIALWSKAAAPFVAIELWTGHGDLDGFEGELSEKPSMLHLAPGVEAQHLACFAFSAGPGPV